MTIHVHTAPEPESVGTFVELDSWAERKINDYLEDLGEGEIAQSIGARGRERSAARIAILEDLRLLIREAVETEEADAARAAGEEPSEAAWRERYPDADELTLRRLGGDR